MPRSLSVPLAIVLACTTSTALHAGEPPSGITVQGEAELRQLPERAALTISVEQRADDPDTAMIGAAEAADAFVAAAREVGAEGGQLRSSDVQLMPQFRWNEETREREESGFLARRDIQVRVEHIDRLADYLRAASATGMTHIAKPDLQLADPASARQQALAQATSDAHASAQAIAQAAGRELGRLLSLEVLPENRGGPQPHMMRASMDSASGDAGAGITIGEIVYGAKVRARYALKD